jgi:Recombinase zinc beta ribbon domain
LRCRACDSPMFYTYTVKPNGRKYGYYICSNSQKAGAHTCTVRAINSQAVESTVIAKIQNTVDETLIKPVFVAWDNLFIQEKARIMTLLLKEILFDHSGNIEATLNPDGIKQLYAQISAPEPATAPAVLEFKAQLENPSKGQAKRRNIDTGKHPIVRVKLVMAYQIEALLKRKQAVSIVQLSQWLNISCPRLSQITGLVFLSPQIQQEILLTNSDNLHSLPEYKLYKIAQENDWQKQAQMWLELSAPLSSNQR